MGSGGTATPAPVGRRSPPVAARIPPSAKPRPRVGGLCGSTDILALALRDREPKRVVPVRGDERPGPPPSGRVPGDAPVAGAGGDLGRLRHVLHARRAAGLLVTALMFPRRGLAPRSSGTLPVVTFDYTTGVGDTPALAVHTPGAPKYPSRSLIRSALMSHSYPFAPSTAARTSSGVTGRTTTLISAAYRRPSAPTKTAGG